MLDFLALMIAQNNEENNGAKKGSQADTKSQGVSPIKATTISIANLLKAVKQTPAAGMYFDTGKIRKARGKHSDHLTKSVLKGIPVRFVSESGQKENPQLVPDLRQPKCAVRGNQVRVHPQCSIEREKVNAGAVGQQGKESARDSGRSAEGKQDAKTSRGLRNAAIESGRFCKTGAKKPAGEAGKYGNSLKAPYGDITGRSYPLSLTR